MCVRSVYYFLGCCIVLQGGVMYCNAVYYMLWWYMVWYGVVLGVTAVCWCGVVCNWAVYSVVGRSTVWWGGVMYVRVVYCVVRRCNCVIGWCTV